MTTIKSIELIDKENNKWWILLSGDTVLSVMTSAKSMAFKLSPDKLVKNSLFKVSIL